MTRDRQSLVALGAALGWVPCAVLLGPVASLRHDVGEVPAGLASLSAVFLTGWAWDRLDGLRPPREYGYGALRRAGLGAQRASVIGSVVGLALMLAAYVAVPAWYLARFTVPRTVVVTSARCVPVKNGCEQHAAVSTPEGSPLPQELVDVDLRRWVGRPLDVRWDRLGYASPVPVHHPGTHDAYSDGAGEGPVTPWLFPVLLVLHLGLTAWFAVTGRRRRAARRPAVA